MVFEALGIAMMGGLFLGVARWNRNRQERIIEESDPVDAEIVHSGTKYVTPPDAGTRDARAADVRFRFEYGGEVHESDWLFPGGTSYGSIGNVGARRAAQYEPGESVTAYVPSDSPRQAYLQKTTSTRTYYVISAVGVGFLLLALVVAVVSLLV